MPKLAGLSDHDIFAISHLAGDLSSNLHIGRLGETTSSAAKLSLMGLHCSSVHPTCGHHLSRHVSPSSGPVSMATRGVVVSRKAGRRARPISITKTHCFKDMVQLPLPSQGLALALVLSITVKSNNLFSFVFYQVHKAKIGGKRIRRCDDETRKDISVPSLYIRKPSLVAQWRAIVMKGP